MGTYIFAVSLPMGSDGLTPTSLWAAEGADEPIATRTLQARLAHGFKIIEATGVASKRLEDALCLKASEACELSSGSKRPPV